MSTDPEGLVMQPYSQDEASGGFLEIAVRPESGSELPKVEFEFYDEHGTLLHRVEKTAHD
jgi:alkaline phosphatase/alkaline phosphatase D